MKYFLSAIITIATIVSCSDNNCIKTSDLVFDQLSEGDRTYYKYDSERFFFEMVQYITPNGDSINDTFNIRTNIERGDYITAKFRLVNACEDIIHVDDVNFPFTFPDPKSLADGQYDFNFSIIMRESRDVISGAGKIRILRQ